MFERMVKDMYIPPNLLAQLSDEQRDVLYYEIRQEQIRRYNEWNQVTPTPVSTPKTRLKVKLPKRKGYEKHVTFVEGPNGQLLVQTFDAEHRIPLLHTPSDSGHGSIIRVQDRPLIGSAQDINQLKQEQVLLRNSRPRIPNNLPRNLIKSVPPRSSSSSPSRRIRNPNVSLPSSYQSTENLASDGSWNYGSYHGGDRTPGLKLIISDARVNTRPSSVTQHYPVHDTHRSPNNLGHSRPLFTTGNWSTYDRPQDEQPPIIIFDDPNSDPLHSRPLFSSRTERRRSLSPVIQITDKKAIVNSPHPIRAKPKNGAVSVPSAPNSIKDWSSESSENSSDSDIPSSSRQPGFRRIPIPISVKPNKSVSIDRQNLFNDVQEISSPRQKNLTQSLEIQREPSSESAKHLNDSDAHASPNTVTQTKSSERTVSIPKKVAADIRRRQEELYKTVNLPTNSNGHVDLFDKYEVPRLRRTFDLPEIPNNGTIPRNIFVNVPVWFHGHLNRFLTERLLHGVGKDGAFLIHISSVFPGYVLSWLWKDVCYHHHISVIHPVDNISASASQQSTVDKPSYQLYPQIDLQHFVSLEELVRFYSVNSLSSVEKQNLLRPVGQNNSSGLPDYAGIFYPRRSASSSDRAPLAR